jgi:hypothetical protein
MLDFKLNGNILEVKETIYGSVDRISYWYYDIEKWVVSTTGKKDETPSIPMTKNSVWWCKRYHLPKVGVTYPDFDYNMTYSEYLKSQEEP